MQPYRLLVDVLIVKICLLRHRIIDFANKTHVNFPKNMKEINKQKKNGMRARDAIILLKKNFLSCCLISKYCIVLFALNNLNGTLNAVL